MITISIGGETLSEEEIDRRVDEGMEKLVKGIDTQSSEDVDKITENLQKDIREEQGLDREIDFDKKVDKALSDIN